MSMVRSPVELLLLLEREQSLPIVLHADHGPGILFRLVILGFCSVRAGATIAVAAASAANRPRNMFLRSFMIDPPDLRTRSADLRALLDRGP
jgi:hypothetical protein